MLSIIDPDEQFDVTKFVEKCDFLIEDIRKRGKLPIVVGKWDLIHIQCVSKC